MGKGEVGLLQVETQRSNRGSVIVVEGIGRWRLPNLDGEGQILYRTTLHLRTTFHGVEWTGVKHWS